MQIKHNIRPLPRTAADIKYIVIHDTANKCIKANAAAHFTYFNDADRQSSADFFVDSLGSLQVNDYLKYYTWHVGDGGGKYGITNQNSIGVEICINADGDYMAAVNNAIVLVRQLKKSLPNAKVVRHYDASRKPCPGSMMANNWSGWDYFMKEINKPISSPAPKTLSWTDIIDKYSSKPDEWIKAVDTIVRMAQDKSNYGDLEIMEFLPELLVKIYNRKV